jgi:hypothetical protein
MKPVRLSVAIVIATSLSSVVLVIAVYLSESNNSTLLSPMLCRCDCGQENPAEPDSAMFRCIACGKFHIVRPEVIEAPSAEFTR